MSCLRTQRSACADPGTFVGGGGRLSSDIFFYSFFCSSAWSTSKKSTIFQGSRGGVQLFPEEGGGPIAYSL